MDCTVNRISSKLGDMVLNSIHPLCAVRVGPSVGPRDPYLNRDYLWCCDATSALGYHPLSLSSIAMCV